MANAKVEEQIVRARIRMLFKAPFFGNLAIRLIPVDASEWCPTAATDGRHLYYNVDFFEKLDKKETEFVVAHEVMHCVYDHMDRRGSRDARLWNCAGDYVINYELHEQRIGAFPKDIQILFDHKYANMSSEEVYDMLLEDQKNGQGNSSMDSFDIHLDPNPQDGEGDGNGQQDPSGKNGRIPLTDEQKEQIRDEIKQAVMEAAKVAGSGNCPAGIRRMIKNLVEPQMDWRELLNCQIQSCFKSDFTFARPNRKMWGTGIVLPGMLPDEQLSVSIAIDTSGSIGEQMLRDFLSEIKGIMEQFSEYNVNLWTFDTKVHNHQVFSSDNIEDIMDYDIKGGGGTAFDVNWQHMKDLDLLPEKFVMFTDGMPFGSWGDPDYCDTIFIIHGNKKIEAPFGTTCYFEN